MSKLSVQALGRKLLEKRGGRGIREVAREIGVSSATLSRVERGHLPDLDTFSKVCKWLGVDPGQVLGFQPSKATKPKVAVHFKKDRAQALPTAQALAQAILAAQRAFLSSEDQGE
jgi:transcriptional regulator with XRE-family HTH domain